MNPADTANVLVQALPYIQRFRNKIVVVKYGGNAMKPSGSAAVKPSGSAAVKPSGSAAADADGGASQFAEDIVLMQSVGLKPVVVHGGGPQITDLMKRLGKQAEFRNGLRVTDAESLEITRMVLVGKVNRELVSDINRHGPLAVGVSGEDAGLITATQHDPELGFVGDVASVNPSILHRLLEQDLIPVIATIGVDETGQAYNINADTVAGAVAVALDAEKVVFLTDIDGLRRDVADETSLISQITAAELRLLIEDGTVASGMIPKVEACLHAVEANVRSAHLIDGRREHVLLLELFTDTGIGTMITRYPE